MKTDRYISSVSNLFINNRLLKFVVIVLAGLQVMNYVETKKADESKRTIIIPIGLSEKVEVAGNWADETYLNAMGVYISQLLYSTTPATVESQYKMLSQVLSTEAYKTYSPDYLLSAVNQAKNQVTQTSKIMGIRSVSEPETYLEIQLVKERYVFNERVEEPKTIRLRIDYKITNGRFNITSLKEEQ